MKRTWMFLLSLVCCTLAVASDDAGKVVVAQLSGEMPINTAINLGSKPAGKDQYFYVYHDKMDRLNHYIPSGWMGDYGDMKYDDRDATEPQDGRTDIKITYNAQAKQGANWAGIYWQLPANNWGEKPGGFDLSGYTKLTFWAKGTTGKEVISTFKVGGISGEYGDSDGVEIGPETLSKKWTKYTIDLTGKNLSHIIGPFCFSFSRDDNPDGMVFYLDEIRFER